MEEKLRFVFEYEQGHRSMTELCQRYEIARETGYVWLRRYREAGVAGLLERRRAAHRPVQRAAGSCRGRHHGSRDPQDVFEAHCQSDGKAYG